MDVVTSLHQDSIHRVIDNIDTETPHQEPQRTCTRNSPCLQQGCMICSTLINHVRNLDVALNGSNASLITHICNLDGALNGRNASLITHIRNLDVTFNSSNALPNSLTIADCPPLSVDHPILLLTTVFQLAIQENDIDELTAINHLYLQNLGSYMELLLYDCSDLCAT